MMGLMSSILEQHKGTSDLQDTVARRSHSVGEFQPMSQHSSLSAAPFFNIETARMTIINEIGNLYVLLAP